MFVSLSDGQKVVRVLSQIPKNAWNGISVSSHLVCPNPALKNTALCSAPCWQWLFLGSAGAMLPSALALSDNTGCCLPGIYPSCCVWKLGQIRVAFWHTLYNHHSSLWAARSHNSVAWGETWMHWTTARAAEKELLFIADYMFWPNSDRKAYLSAPWQAD